MFPPINSFSYVWKISILKLLINNINKLKLKITKITNEKHKLTAEIYWI